MSASAPQNSRQSSFLEVFGVFLRLGLTSFGGPVAHLGFFRTEFVERRRWVDEQRYADLVALCQFLPGPASSQVGIALGLTRGGWSGSLAAWLGFTLPSALLLAAFALGLARFPEALASGALQGLKIAAVAVVAQAVWGMAKSLCPDGLRVGLALAAAGFTLLAPGAWAQLLALCACAIAGRLLVPIVSRAGPPPARAANRSADTQGAAKGATEGGSTGATVSRRAGLIALGSFAGLLAGLGVASLAFDSALIRTLEIFYRSGSLVFGGGHVVLPLLQASVVPSGLISNAEFLAGYGAAQAVPGPLFTFAAFIGAAADPELAGVTGWSGALVCVLAIFLPAWLLVVGALPFWESLRGRPWAQRSLAGLNAGVVGLLLAALYDPVWTSAIGSRLDFALALLAFGLLVFARLSPLWVVLLLAGVGSLIT